MNRESCNTCPDLCALKYLAIAMQEAAVDAEATLTVAQLQADMAQQSNQTMELRDIENAVIREITGDRPRESTMDHAGIREIAYGEEGKAHAEVIDAYANLAIARDGGTIALGVLRKYISDMQRLCYADGPRRGLRVPLTNLVIPFADKGRLHCLSDLQGAPTVFYETAGMFPQTAGLSYEASSQAVGE